MWINDNLDNMRDMYLLKGRPASRLIGAITGSFIAKFFSNGSDFLFLTVCIFVGIEAGDLLHKLLHKHLRRQS